MDMELASFAAVQNSLTKVGFFSSCDNFFNNGGLGFRASSAQTCSVHSVHSNVQNQAATIPPNPHLTLLFSGLFEKHDPRCNILQKNKICNITKACSLTIAPSSISH